MKRASEKVLWTAALSASLAIHAALATALALAPAAEHREQAETSIVIQSAAPAIVETADAPSVSALLAPESSVIEAVDAATVKAVRPVAPQAVAEAVDMPSASAPLVQERAIVAALDDAMTEAVSLSQPQAIDAVDARDWLDGPSMPEIADGPPAAAATLAPIADSVDAEGPRPPLAAGVATDTSTPLAVVPRAVANIPAGQGAMTRPVADTVAVQPRAAREAGQPTPASPQPVRQAIAAPSQAVPAGRAPSTAAPVVAQEQRVAIVRPIEPRTLSSRESPAEAYGKLLGAIAAERESRCFLALASNHGETIGVDGFATAASRVDRFNHSLGNLIETPVDVRGHIVSDAQCAALAFAGGLGGYPEASLSVELLASEIASGAEISGRVGNFKRRWLYLVVVDDDGKVQEIDNLFLEDGGMVGFRAPITLTDEPVDTVQLMLAIASDEVLETIWLREGDGAGAYFSLLRDEIQRGGGNVDFGVASFIVR